MEAANDNWIVWAGGECPVARGTRVDILDADGHVWAGVAAGRHVSTHDTFWTHTTNFPHNRIVAYRVAS